SYQLDLCPSFAPDISILINLSPDHIDRHGDMAGYVAAKKKIFRGAGTAVIGIDDRWSKDVYAGIMKTERKTLSVSCAGAADIAVSSTGLLCGFDLKQCENLQGPHNWQNAAMAYAACRAQGISDAEIFEALKSFPGLAHRQNIVAVHNGIRYVNDSKATNDQAAAMALRAFDPIYWIAGGKPKDGGYPDCEKYIRHVRHAFLIGAAEEKMAAWLETQKTPFTRCGTMDRAVKAADALAQREKLENAAVLLSPACASFDQFKNFEQRGEIFADLVGKLAAKEALA
ncbi:MAG: UDP-N-acetylmuramoyl-L-alanine--D-glutamate ligase, partial [Alphaproteobacteria bacterium]|nr:UDP-N-acetylmuramoyl-L-alanine--D-glutamate ligase [Alphaproteobacteria bacterium]